MRNRYINYPLGFPAADVLCSFCGFDPSLLSQRAARLNEAHIEMGFIHLFDALSIFRIFSNIDSVLKTAS
jgi:hypothetical protein